MTNPSTEKINEALHLLSEAAKDKKSEIRNLIGEKYTNLKEIVEHAASSVTDSVHDTQDRIFQVRDRSAEKVHEAAKSLDEHVQGNPWAYIAGAAFGALLLGFMLGSHRHD